MSPPHSAFSKSFPAILHVDDGMHWRGGQQQVFYLLKGLTEKNIPTALVSPPGSMLGARSKEAGLCSIPLTMRGEMDFMAGFRIASLCKTRGFKILQAHTGHALSLCLWAKLFYPPLQLIAVRRVDFHIGKNLLSRWKYTHPWIDRIVCLSRAIQEVLLADGIPKEKLVVIPSGIDLHRFDSVQVPNDFRKKWGIPEDHVLIGTVAAMAGHKDYPTFLSSARMVLDRTDRVSFCVVGDGPEEKKVHQMAESLGLLPHIRFVGFRSDVEIFLKAFDIFVLSSKKEGLGTSLLDAQAVGIPVVACASGGIPEIVIHEKNGLLVPSQNPLLLAEAILRLVNDATLRKRLGQTGRIMVQAFDITHTVEKYIALYEELGYSGENGERKRGNGK